MYMCISIESRFFFFGKWDQNLLDIVKESDKIRCRINSKVDATNEIVMVITQESVTLKKIPGKEQPDDGQKITSFKRTLVVHYRTSVAFQR